MFATLENSVFPLTTNHIVYYDAYYQNICASFNKSALWFHKTQKIIITNVTYNYFHEKHQIYIVDAQNGQTLVAV